MSKTKEIWSETLTACEVNSIDAIMFAVSESEVTMAGTIKHPALVTFFETMFRGSPQFKEVIEEALERATCSRYSH